jgi:hypothetical protein
MVRGGAAARAAGETADNLAIPRAKKFLPAVQALSKWNRHGVMDKWDHGRRVAAQRFARGRATANHGIFSGTFQPHRPRDGG